VFLTLPDFPASSNADRLKLPSLELPGYDHGMLVTAHLHYSSVLIHITLVDALGRPQASQLDDQYILLADEATTADLHRHLIDV